MVFTSRYPHARGWIRDKLLDFIKHFWNSIQSLIYQNIKNYGLTESVDCLCFDAWLSCVWRGRLHNAALTWPLPPLSLISWAQLTHTANRQTSSMLYSTINIIYFSHLGWIKQLKTIYTFLSVSSNKWSIFPSLSSLSLFTYSAMPSAQARHQENVSENVRILIN